MDQIIKINGRDYEVEHIYDIIDSWIKNGELIEFKKEEFFWTKKHFIKILLGLSKVVPFEDKINIYLFALRLQFTNVYDKYLKSRIFSDYS